jgi:hypothetical protein
LRVSSEFSLINRRILCWWRVPEWKVFRMAVEEFVPPTVPRVDNSTGPPETPSGSHPVFTAPTIITELGVAEQSEPPTGAGSNIHGTPRPPSGTHESTG